jgi:hypothetical protein
MASSDEEQNPNANDIKRSNIIALKKQLIIEL